MGAFTLEISSFSTKIDISKAFHHAEFPFLFESHKNHIQSAISLPALRTSARPVVSYGAEMGPFLGSQNNQARGGGMKV